MKYCSNCGTASEEDAKFCANCAASLQKNQQTNKENYHSNQVNYNGYSSMNYQQPISDSIKVLLYILTLFITLVGIIVGIVYMNDPMEEKRRFGKGLLIFAIIWSIIGFIAPILLFVSLAVSYGMGFMYF